MILALNCQQDIKVCDKCGYHIPDPYFFDLWYLDYRTARRRKKIVLCSTCHYEWAQHRQDRQDKEEHRKLPSLGPAICECGKHLPDCHVWDCHRPDPPPKKKRLLKPGFYPAQREMFR